MRRNAGNFIKFLTCFVLIWLIVSCTINPTVQSTQTTALGSTQTNAVVTTPEVKETESRDITQTLVSETSVHNPTNTNYSFEIYYDNETHLLSVDELVVYFNWTESPLETIPFVVNNDIQVSSVYVNGKLFHSIPEINKNFMEISIGEILKKGASIEINITYSIVVPSGKGVFGWTDNQINLADFYPFIPPYKSEVGWLINEPGKVGEYKVFELSDFNLVFNTNLAGNYELFTNAHSDNNDGIYFINASSYRNVVLSICSDCVRSEVDYGTFKVIGCFLPGDKSKGDDAIAIIGQSILYFSNLFGVAYPHGEMTIIEANFPDGMEYDGLFFLSKDYFDQYKGGFKNYLSLLSIHETAHQWWYGLVGNDQANEPWLDEALATYSELLYLEEFHPDLVSWWWDYRVFTYNPIGSVSSTIYDFNDNRPYINAVYLRGALYLEDLRSNLSNESFISRLREYSQRYNEKIADSKGFESVFLVDLTPKLIEIQEKYFGN